MIEIKDLKFQYAGAASPSLQDISLSIADGECVLFCGKSGCGKTTMTRLFNGMIPDFYEGELTGSVRINDLDPISCSMHELSKTVGTVFQNPRTQFYTVNTTSEIAFGCENYGMPSEVIRQRVIQAATDLHMTDLLDRNIFKLSGGEKQKIAFASIYALNPDIYVLDEPSSNLDMFSIRELRDILKLLKRQGKTIILAEHRTWYLEQLVDRAMFMEDGKIIREYSMQELAAFTNEQRRITGIRPVNLAAFHPVSPKPDLSKHQISWKGVSFGYKKESNLQIPQMTSVAGHITAVIGKNGAGKSTFVSVLCGILKNQKGTVSLDQETLRVKKRLSLSYMVLQEVNHQLFTDSVEEEIVLGIREPSKQKLETVLEQMDITDLRARHPMTLSGGQKQRVAVAAAMFCGKQILVFDEPTSGLDFSHMTQTAELLQSLKSPETFIFVITHDYEFILSACDMVVQIDNGRVQDTYELDTAGVEKLQEFYQISEYQQPSRNARLL